MAISEYLEKRKEEEKQGSLPRFHEFPQGFLLTKASKKRAHI
jgi:hypothetical protein